MSKEEKGDGEGEIEKEKVRIQNEFVENLHFDDKKQHEKIYGIKSDTDSFYFHAIISIVVP